MQISLNLLQSLWGDKEKYLIKLACCTRWYRFLFLVDIVKDNCIPAAVVSLYCWKLSWSNQQTRYCWTNVGSMFFCWVFSVTFTSLLTPVQSCVHVFLIIGDSHHILVSNPWMDVQFGLTHNWCILCGLHIDRVGIYLFFSVQSWVETNNLLVVNLQVGLRMGCLNPPSPPSSQLGIVPRGLPNASTNPTSQVIWI